MKRYSDYSNVDSETPLNWWLQGGISSSDCLAAWCPIGAASLNASLVNLNNPGTRDLTIGDAPAFSSTNGWTFPASGNKYFHTGITADNNTTVIVAFDNTMTKVTSVPIGAYQSTGTKGFFIKNIGSGIPGAEFYNGGSGVLENAPWEKDAILAMSGTKVYRNDVEEGTIDVGAALPTIEMYLGSLNISGTSSQGFNGYLTAAVVYSRVLTADEIYAVMASMPRSDYYSYRKEYTDLQLGAFVGYNMSVFGDNNIPADPDSFAPTDLDTDEWVETFVAAGMKYAIFYAKSEDGFCNYPTQYIYPGGSEPYGITSGAWYQTNNIDPVEEFIKSCRKYDIKPMLYYSMKDSCYTAVTGKDYTDDWANYWTMMETQLTEILTGYDFDGIWFDLWFGTVGYTNLPYATMYSFVKGLKPNIYLINNGHVFPSNTSEITTRERPGIADAEMGANVKDLCEDLDSPRVDNDWWGSENAGLAAYKDIPTMQTRMQWLNARNSSLVIVTVPATTGHLRPYNKQWLELLGS